MGSSGRPQAQNRAGVPTAIYHNHKRLQACKRVQCLANGSYLLGTLLREML
jgi:hypothetical protein